MIVTSPPSRTTLASPNGSAYQIALNFNGSDFVNAITVSKSINGGDSWSPLTTLTREDGAQNVSFVDKESITADPYNSNYVYAVWDRIESPNDNPLTPAQAYANAHPAAMAALTNPALTGDEANEADWRMAEIPAANGHGTAIALATIFGAVTDGSERLISAATLRRACTGQGRYPDLVLGFPLEFGLGFALSGPEHHFGPNPAAFGHDGFGGSAVGGDADAGVAIAYVMNRMGMNLADDPRKMALIDAVYRSGGRG